MKYSDKNPPLKCFMTQSTWYKLAKKGGKPVGVLWHDTGCGNPYIKRYVQPDDNAKDRAYWLNLLGKNQYGNDWNHIYRGAGLNCWIGRLADGTVSTVQVGTWDTHAWGCGEGAKGSCNGYINKDWVNEFWIQFEICDDYYQDPAYLKLVYEEACEITAYLCKKFGIDPKGTVDFHGIKVPTILCHADSFKLGLGSNHGDVNVWFNQYGYSMDKARKDVAALMTNSASTTPAPSTKPTTSTPTTSTPKEVKATGVAQKGPDKTIAGTYVATDDLHIRNGAGIKCKSLVVMPKGTIVKNYGYYSIVNGIKWLYIQATVNGTLYTGFSSIAYLKKK